jgi:hypothetical protein
MPKNQRPNSIEELLSAGHRFEKLEHKVDAIPLDAAPQTTDNAGPAHTGLIQEMVT